MTRVKANASPVRDWRRTLLSTTAALPITLGLVVGTATVGVALATALPNPVAAACNPCAAKNPCNPCAANPCAAKACNPCNPCAAAACNPCNPCNPCAAADTPELSEQELAAVYDCIIKEMTAGYAKAGDKAAKDYVDWARFSTVSYPSATHGGRFVNNYSNSKGRKAYGKFEDVGTMPVGSVIAKDSFVVTMDGKVGAGPLFLMEKMKSGFNAEHGDWRYTLIMPSGQVVGTSGGKGSNVVGFCAECHAVVGENQDHLYFLPEEFRVTSN